MNWRNVVRVWGIGRGRLLGVHRRRRWGLVVARLIARYAIVRRSPDGRWVSVRLREILMLWCVVKSHATNSPALVFHKRKPSHSELSGRLAATTSWYAFAQCPASRTRGATANCPLWADGQLRTVGTMTDTPIVSTDSRSRMVFPGRPNQMFVRRDFEDGSILLEPAQVVTAAQAEYDRSPELRELLTRAAAAPTVERTYTRR